MRVLRQRVRVLALAVAVAVSALAASAGADSPSSASSAPLLQGEAASWPMFRGNPTRTGVATGEPGSTAALRWAFPTGGPVASSPAVVDGVVFFGSSDSAFYAVQAHDGSLFWSLKTNGPVQSSPAVAEQTVFVGSMDGLYAIDVQGRNPVLLFGDAPVDSSPVVLSADNGQALDVYFGARNGLLYKISYSLAGQRPMPAPVWSVRLGSPVYSSPAVKDGIVYVGAEDAILAFDAGSGEPRGEYGLVGLVDTTPAVGEECLFVSSPDGVVYPIVIADLARLCWEPSGTAAQVNAPARQTNGGALISSPAVYVAERDSQPVHRVFVVVGDELLAIEATQGGGEWQAQEIWRRPVARPAGVPSSPVVVDGESDENDAVYVGGGDGVVYAFDAASGTPRWSFPTESGAAITSSPAVVDGVVYVGSSAGHLYAIDERATTAA